MPRGVKVIFSDSDVLKAIAESTTFADVSRKIGYANGSVKNKQTIQNIANKYNISTEHLQGTNYRVPRKCPVCKKSMGREHRGVTCSQECSFQHRYLQYIERWKQGKEDGIRGAQAISEHIRRYLFEKYNNACEECGWNKTNLATGNIPLQVHHKDGDWSNNKEDNLSLLCPNCHSLTATFMNSNKGKGRQNRYKTE